MGIGPHEFRDRSLFEDNYGVRKRRRSVMREHGAASTQNAHEQAKRQQQPTFHSEPHEPEFVV
jgi:hypothetical protein